jgi:Ca2+-binding RTX toxin-like protein
MTDIFGGPGFDTLQGTPDSDRLFGAAGNDLLDGLGGSDESFGGEGDDVITLDFAFSPIDGLADGGIGFDRLEVYTRSFGPTYFLLPSSPTVGGVMHRDFEALTWYGGTRDGPQTIAGAAGADYLFSGPRADRLTGAGGDDVLFGNGGDDVLQLDLLDDGTDIVLDGGTEVDTLLVFADESLTNFAMATSGAIAGVPYRAMEKLEWRGGAPIGQAVSGWTFADTLLGGGGTDTLNGSSGDDLLEGYGQADWMYGGTGADTLGGMTGADSLYGGLGSDIVDGGNDADTLYGGSDSDTLSGGLGADLLSGDPGDDQIFGGAEADTLLSGDGIDELVGGGGNDHLHGGPGDDVFGYKAGDGGPGFDPVFGGDGFDTIRGKSANSVIGLETISGIERIASGGFANVWLRLSDASNALDLSAVTVAGLAGIDLGAGDH